MKGKQERLCGRSLPVIVYLLALLWPLVVARQVQTEVWVDSTSSCSSACGASDSPYVDFASALNENWAEGTELTIKLRPGTYPLNVPFPTAKPSKVSLIGMSSEPKDVNLLLCDAYQTFPLLIRSITLSAIPDAYCDSLLYTFGNPAGILQLELEDVVVQGASNNGLWTSNAAFVTKNVQFRRTAISAVILHSTTWESEGSLIIKNYELDGYAAVNMTDTEWKQQSVVEFVNNTANEIKTSYLASLKESTWYSMAPVIFQNNSLPASSSFVHLEGENAKLTSTYPMLVEGTDQESSTLFSCTGNAVLWAPETCNACASCTTVNANTVPILSWDKRNLNTTIASGGTQVIVLSTATTALTIQRSGSSSNTPLSVSIRASGAGLDSITITNPSSQVTIPAGSPTGELTLQLISSSPANGLPVTLTIQPFVPNNISQLPAYFLSRDASQVTVITSSSFLSLPTLNILFPFPQPDVICFPPPSSSSNGTDDNGEQVERSVLTKLKRLVEVKKKQDGSLVEEKAQDLTELAWTQEQPSAGEVLFVANISSLQPQGGGGAGGGGGALVEVMFQSAEKGSTVELEDGESIGFEEDSLKWSLLIRNWPWSDPSNLFLLETSFRTGAQQWLNLTKEAQPQDAPQPDQEGEGEGGGQKGEEQEVWRLEGVFSSALLRVLLRSWVDGQLDTPQAVAVEVWLSEEDEAEVEARFMFAHFEEEMRYDPDISVLLNGEGSKGDGEEEEGGEEDGLWWKITVPVVVVAVVALAAAVAVLVVAVRQRREATRVNQGGAVNF